MLGQRHALFSTRHEFPSFEQIGGFRGSAQPIPVPADLCDALAPATHCLQEWAEYWLQCRGADCLYVGSTRLDPVGEDLFRLRFEKQLGLCILQPYAGGEPLSAPLHVEVISAKFSTPARHLAFYRTLLGDLFARAAHLPFTVSAMTARGVNESLRPPTPLFTLHFLCQHAATLRTALLIIQAAPHRRLSDRSNVVPLAEANEIDVDVLIQVLQSSHDWKRAGEFPLANRLRGYAPVQVWQRQAEETFDTPENRFVLDFLHQLLVAAEMLRLQPWWSNVPPDRQRRVRESASLVRQAIHDPIFTDLGPLHHFPTASQVLLRREGYRELLSLWQVFHHAHRPLFGALRHAIDVRDVAKLYEMWVFFALVKDIAVLLDASPIIDLRSSAQGGLGWESEARFDSDNCLIYNRNWPRGPGGWASYSVPLRPDFTWTQQGKPEVVFDAKFRLDRSQLEGVEEDNAAEASAQPTDLYKMHTYRDALGVRTAVCVYPGDASVFYDRSGQQRLDFEIRDVLLGNLSGVGALQEGPRWCRKDDAMNEDKLKHLAEEFSCQLQSEDLQAHRADHLRRSQRAQAMLAADRIPNLTEVDLRELFLDSDAFGFWKNKEWEFNDRIQTSGLDGLRRALLELVTRAERGLTADDLKHVWSMRGLGMLLSTELIAYRFPSRYLPYSPNVTLPAFKELGDDIKASMPRGHQSDAFIYLALEPRMVRVRQALADAGVPAVDNLVADIFLWWVKRGRAAASNVWLFQANPEQYDLAEELKHSKVGDSGGWTVSRYRADMREGDSVILWQAGTKAGVYALGELIGAASRRERRPSKAEVKTRPYLKSLWRVDFRYTRILGEPILKGTLKSRPVLRNLQVIRNPQGTNFRVTPDEWVALQELIGDTEAGGVINPPSIDLRGINLRAALTSSLAPSGLHFTKWQIATFYTALQTKGFVILSGIRGTGKTKLAQHFAALFSRVESDGDTHGCNWLFLPVRPDWRDGKSLLGYFNPLTGTYERTPFLRFLLRASESYRAKDGQPWFVLLDEMNLAHVEYYFADLLSVLESGRDKAGWTSESLRLSYPDDASGDLPPREIPLPPSLYIVGTVNVDETTHSFSPKVLDRAFTLELTEADFSAYPTPSLEGSNSLNEEDRRAILRAFTGDGEFIALSKQRITDCLSRHPEVRTQLQTLNTQLRPFALHFGYRSFDEIVSFIDAADTNGLFEGLSDTVSQVEATLDAAVLMKVLPKFHGSRGKLEAPLRAVLAWCVDPNAPADEAIDDALKQIESGDEAKEVLSQLSYRCPATAERVGRMLRLLYTDGFAAFG